MSDKKVSELEFWDESISQSFPWLACFYLLDVDLESVQVEHPLMADTGSEHDFARFLKE